MLRGWISTMPYRRGDVVLVAFPNSDLRTFKKRPALVVQDETVHTGLRQRVVASITSNMARTGTTRITIRQNSNEGQQMGLRTDSVIVIDNLATIPDRAIDKVIGSCPVMGSIEGALKLLFGLT
jgi:mRNA interferase MazF